MATTNHMGLYLLSGIPVVQLHGDWDEATERHLAETVTRLMQTGHLEIIVNLSQMQRLPLTERRWLEGLERIAATLRGRRGWLDMVGTFEQVEAGLRLQALHLLRWATSEEQALSHIFGIPHVVRGQKIPARLA